MTLERRPKTIRHTPKAGQYAKGRANALTTRGFTVLVSVAMASGFALGAASAVLLQNTLVWPEYRGLESALAIAVTLALGVGLFFLVRRPADWVAARTMRPLDAYLDGLTRQRVRWMRGGQAEGFVSWLLTDLGPDYHLFDNLSLGEGAEDIDHILIGPTGLFAVSTKGHRGTLRVGPDGAITMNGRPRPWARDVTRQVMRLRSQLEVVTRTKLPWVQAVLAAPQAHIETPGPPATPGRAAPGGVWFLHQDDLTDALTERKHVLPRQTVEELARAVTELQARRSDAAPAAPPVDSHADRR